jgi:sugar transferase (PEP-CTERM/EpsH1 system associated)
MTKRVVHLVYSFGCGGLEKVIANLINHSSQYDVEHVLVSLTDDMSMVDQIDEKIKVFVLDKKPGNDIKTHVKLYSLLKRLKPQAVNTYNFGTIEYHFMAKMAGVPIRVHSDHGRGGDDPAGKSKIHNLFRKFIVNFITEYIVVSYDLYQWILNDIKVKSSKLTLIFNGVDIPQNKEFVSSEPKIFVTVGRLDKVKNQELLINAFAQAVKSIPNFEQCTLNIVGNGPLFNELRLQIESLEMQEHIHLLGFRDDITAILDDSDVFVLSSVYEAMPMTILEAMANKTPVICTNVGGISQFITEEQAWFVESNNRDALTNKLDEVKNNKETQLIKVNNAYKLVNEKYAMKEMVKAYMDKYSIKENRK